MEIYVGAALSNLNMADLVFGKVMPEDLDWFICRYMDKFPNENFFAELQPEFKRGWVWLDKVTGKFYPRESKWERILAGLAGTTELERSYLGVHTPIDNVDVLDNNEFIRRLSIANIKASMDFAHKIGAEYLVIHLVQKDRWEKVNERRAIWEEMSMKIFSVLAEHYQNFGHQYEPLIEVLEYPKFPCSPQEITKILYWAQQILPKTKLCFDVSHLWRSRGLIFENVDRKSGQFDNVFNTKYFVDELDDCLNCLEGNDVYLWHLGGCYGIDTHLIPGLYPDENPFDAKFRLDMSNSFFDECSEMNYNEVLRRIIGFCVKHNQPVRMMLEIHRRNYLEVLESIREVKSAIIQKIQRGDWV